MEMDDESENEHTAPSAAAAAAAGSGSLATAKATSTTPARTPLRMESSFRIGSALRLGTPLSLRSNTAIDQSLHAQIQRLKAPRASEQTAPRTPLKALIDDPFGLLTDAPPAPATPTFTFQDSASKSREALAAFSASVRRTPARTPLAAVSARAMLADVMSPMVTSAAKPPVALSSQATMDTSAILSRTERTDQKMHTAVGTPAPLLSLSMDAGPASKDHTRDMEMEEESEQTGPVPMAAAFAAPSKSTAPLSLLDESIPDSMPAMAQAVVLPSSLAQPLLPACSVTAPASNGMPFSQFLSLAGIGFYDQCARRRATMAVCARAPEQLGDFLRIGWMKLALETYSWGTDHISARIEELRGMPALGNGGLGENRFARALLSADEEQLARIQTDMGLLKSHCRARAKTRWHEWRAKVEATIAQALEEYHNSITTEQTTLAAHAARLARHREAMAARAEVLRAEINRLRAAVVPASHRAELVVLAQRHTSLATEMKQRETDHVALQTRIADGQAKLQCLQEEHVAAAAEGEQLARALQQATHRVSPDQVAAAGALVDAHLQLITWRLRMRSRGLLELVVPGGTVTLRVTGPSEKATVSDVVAAVPLPEIAAMRFDRLRGRTLRQVCMRLRVCVCVSVCL